MQTLDEYTSGSEDVAQYAQDILYNMFNTAQIGAPKIEFKVVNSNVVNYTNAAPQSTEYHVSYEVLVDGEAAFYVETCTTAFADNDEYDHGVNAGYLLNPSGENVFDSYSFSIGDKNVNEEYVSEIAAHMVWMVYRN